MAETESWAEERAALTAEVLRLRERVAELEAVVASYQAADALDCELGDDETNPLDGTNTGTLV